MKPALTSARIEGKVIRESDHSDQLLKRSSIMKTHVRFLFVTALLAIFSTPAVAQDSVCDVLQDATSGLYGLCTAYCEAQDCGSYADGEQPNSCNRLLANYNRTRTDDDPQMPCATSCPCWGMAELSSGGSMLLNSQQAACAAGGDMEVASWFGDNGSITFIANENPNTGETTCSYANSVTMDIQLNVPTSSDQDEECRAGIHALQEDFAICF